MTEGNNINITRSGQNLQIEAVNDGIGSNLTLGPGGRLEVKTQNNNNAVTLEDFFNAGGMITAHGPNGGIGARMWGILSGTDSITQDQLRGGGFATFGAAGGEGDGSVWIRTNGTSDANSWGVISTGMVMLPISL